MHRLALDPNTHMQIDAGIPTEEIHNRLAYGEKSRTPKKKDNPSPVGPNLKTRLGTPPHITSMELFPSLAASAAGLQ